MEAPDKIYIPYYPNYDGIDTHLSDEWFEGKAIDNVEGWVEYICKDVVDEIIKIAEDHAYFAGQEKFREKLIEWAKEKLENLKSLLDTDPYKEVYVGQCEVYKELIDKLNLI